MVKAAGLIADGDKGRKRWSRALATMVDTKRVKKYKGDRYTPNITVGDLIDDYDEVDAVTEFAGDDASE